jgi:hypothetical protein
MAIVMGHWASDLGSEPRIVRMASSLIQEGRRKCSPLERLVVLGLVHQRSPQGHQCGVSDKDQSRSFIQPQHTVLYVVEDHQIHPAAKLSMAPLEDRTA